MQLKKYQQRALDALNTFLSEAAVKPHSVAYNIACQVGEPGFYASIYEPLRQLPRVPYCCLRLPTGGGKTLLGAHAIGLAHKHRIDGPDYPVAIWLVPSTTIGNQTLDALKTPGHPYRAAIEDAFGGHVRVLSIDERRQITPQDLASSAHVFVATVQAFRVAQAAQRNVYKDDENYAGFFKDRVLPDDLMRNPDDADTRPGEMSWSFANIMRLVRPVVIVDEAHNFVTGLSETTGARLNPSAIIEFTATPVRSNVIVSATADELKAEQMIKLPIHLTQHNGWESAIIHALQQRAGLAKIARAAKEPIRPIALYQAQAATAGAEATVDVVKAKLIEHGIPEAAIAVATGTQRELDGLDLFDPACLVEHIITVEALREGWDCSFAYVFCSVANIQSSTAVEQLLGRVLRMPFAKRRATEELNRAYAHVTGVGFHAAANRLKDTLVAMGFDEKTARDEIIAQHAADAAAAVLPMVGRSPIPPVILTVRPDLAAVPPAVRDALTVIGTDDGGSEGVSVVIDPDASDEILAQIGDILAPLAGDEDPRPAISAHVERRQAAATPSQRGVTFTVPALLLEQYGELDKVEPETLLDLSGWTLDGVDPDLPNFVISETPDAVIVDVDDGQVRISQNHDQLTLQLNEETKWTASELSRWLDRMTRQMDVAQPVFLEYCRRVVVHLVERRGMSLASLVRAKDVLKRAIEARVKVLRAAAGGRGMQMLLGDITPVLGLGENGFTFGAGQYLPPRPYSGGQIWERHFYPKPDDLKDGSEEMSCALAIDRHPAVKHWVRNIPKGGNAYWLPTATDRFYPDFVAELTDGRLLVLEYKGSDRITDDDSKEKANIGARLAEVSEGKVIFWMADRAKDQDFRARLDHVLKETT